MILKQADMENQLQSTFIGPRQEKNKEETPLFPSSKVESALPSTTDKAQEKSQKLKEYEKMFQILYKQKEYEKIKSLATELSEFDPGSESAEKWRNKAEKKQSNKGFFRSLFVRAKKMNPEEGLLITPSSLPILPLNTEKDSEPPRRNFFMRIFRRKAEQQDSASSKVSNNSPSIVQKPKKEFNLLTFSKLFMNFTAVFIVLTGAVLYVDFLDKGNALLSFVGVKENTGSQLHAASEKLNEAKSEVALLESDIEKYKTDYKNKDLATVQSVIAQRIPWQDIFFKIKEVTNSVYELNDFFKYVDYYNYDFDAQKQTIRITGRLTDPQGKNLTKLIELEEAFMYYPKDKNNPEDKTKPFFQGFKELTSLSKVLDEETGLYTSDFQLSFSLNIN